MRQLFNFISGRCKEIAFPERIICNDEVMFLQKVNQLNGIKHKLYFSVFDCDEFRNYELASIHCVPFDLDNENSLQNMIKLWEYCKLKNYKCLMIFSTRGFWFYLFTKNHHLLTYKKDALKLSQEFIAREIGLTIGNGKTCDIDQQIIGDIARISRLPNSFDKERKRFCIPITIEDLHQDYNFIITKSQKQNFEYVYYNDDYFDISLFNKKILPEYENFKIDNEYIDVNESIIKMFLPCIKSWLEKPEQVTNKVRCFFARYCRDFGISPESCNMITKKYWNNIKDSSGRKTKYEEFIQEQQIEGAYYRQHKPMPNCNTLINCKLCPEKCKRYAEFNFPLYK